jgi:hypothetical protein
VRSEDSLAQEIPRKEEGAFCLSATGFDFVLGKEGLMGRRQEISGNNNAENGHTRSKERGCSLCILSTLKQKRRKKTVILY